MRAIKFRVWNKKTSKLRKVVNIWFNENDRTHVSRLQPISAVRRNSLRLFNKRLPKELRVLPCWKERRTM